MIDLQSPIGCETYLLKNASLMEIPSKCHCNSTKWIIILSIQELSSTSDHLLQASLLDIHQ